MDEIAKEYDVIVLGTGKPPPPPPTALRQHPSLPCTTPIAPHRAYCHGGDDGGGGVASRRCCLVQQALFYKPCIFDELPVCAWKPHQCSWQHHHMSLILLLGICTDDEMLKHRLDRVHPLWVRTAYLSTCHSFDAWPPRRNKINREPSS